MTPNEIFELKTKEYKYNEKLVDKLHNLREIRTELFRKISFYPTVQNKPIELRLFR